MRHNIIRSKLKKGRCLMKDPIISRHVPETHWFRSSSFKRMIKTYSILYIKPDIGRKGNGIIRVKKRNDSKIEISYKQTTFKCSREDAFREIKKILNPKKKYIIQRGIDLSTYHKRPFDVRVVLQKPLKLWRVSLMFAKIAPQKTSIVTNVAKGAKEMNVIKTFQGVDQPLNQSKVIRDLIDVSYQISQILGSYYPLKIVGLDMGIDKKGKVWFIEANTKPDCSDLKNLDRKMYRRYREAKKLMAK